MRDELKDSNLLDKLIKKTVSIALEKRQAFQPLIFFKKNGPSMYFLYICRAENLQCFLREGGYMPLESDGYPDSRTLVKI